MLQQWLSLLPQAEPLRGTAHLSSVTDNQTCSILASQDDSHLSAGPWKQLLDISKDISFSVEVDDSRRAAYRRASSSVKAVTERIRQDRVYGSSMMMTGTLGPFAGSIGGFASQAGSLGAKVSASQDSLGGLCHAACCCTFPEWLGCSGSPCICCYC